MLIDNHYYNIDEKSCLIKNSLYIRVFDEPLQKTPASDPRFKSSDPSFKCTASFREFQNGTFDYSKVNMYDYHLSTGLKNNKILVVENIFHVYDAPEIVKKMFEKFFARYLMMEENKKDIDGKEYEPWRWDIIRDECNHSFIKQHAKYPHDDYYRYTYMNVQS